MLTAAIMARNSQSMLVSHRLITRAMMFSASPSSQCSAMSVGRSLQSSSAAARLALPLFIFTAWTMRSLTHRFLCSLIVHACSFTSFVSSSSLLIIRYLLFSILLRTSSTEMCRTLVAALVASSVTSFLSHHSSYVSSRMGHLAASLMRRALMSAWSEWSFLFVFVIRGFLDEAFCRSV